MCEAYAAAGYDPKEFWGLSPRLFACHMQGAAKRFEGEQQARAWAVWHIEALSRTKKLPDFQKFAAIKKQVQQQTPGQIEAMGLALAKAWGAKSA